MSEHQTLAEIIKEKQRALTEAESVVLRLRNELTEAKQILLGPSPSATTAPSNSTEMAERVLALAGEPMHVNEILNAIEREFHVSVRYATLVGNMSRLVKKGKIFERVGPNRFGLLSLADQREAHELFERDMIESERNFSDEMA